METPNIPALDLFLLQNLSLQAGLEDIEAPSNECAVEIPLTPGVSFPFDEDPLPVMHSEALQASHASFTHQSDTIHPSELELPSQSSGIFPAPSPLDDLSGQSLEDLMDLTTFRATESRQVDALFEQSRVDGGDASGSCAQPAEDLETAEAAGCVHDLFLNLGLEEPSNGLAATETNTSESANDLSAVTLNAPMAHRPAEHASNETSEEPMVAGAGTNELAVTPIASQPCPGSGREAQSLQENASSEMALGCADSLLLGHSRDHPIEIDDNAAQDSTSHLPLSSVAMRTAPGSPRGRRILDDTVMQATRPTRRSTRCRRMVRQPGFLFWRDIQLTPRRSARPIQERVKVWLREDDRIRLTELNLMKARRNWTKVARIQKEDQVARQQWQGLNRAAGNCFG